MSSKFQPPPWVRSPQLENCGLRVMKDGKTIEVIKTIATKSYTLFGRNASMCDHKLEHQSISRRHSLIGHGSSGNIYLMDLASSHGTYLNDLRLPKHKRHPLKDNDIIRFGASSRVYVIKFDIEVEDISKFKHKIHEDTRHKNQNQSKSISNQKSKSLLQFTKESTDHSSSNLESTENSQNESNSNHCLKRSKMDTDSLKDDRNVKRQKLEETPVKKLKHVSCYHLLIKHKESRRPSSWKTKEILRSKDTAMEIITKLRKEICSIKDPKERIEKFAKVAKIESDCNSAKRGGDLGSFGRNKMQLPFENTAFNLEIGDISQPIETVSGMHIILRVA